MIAPGVEECLQAQSIWCREMGAPFYGELLDRAGEDLRSGGAVAAVFDGWQGQPVADALALRLLGAVHRLVLAGEAPDLARHYPSVGGGPTWPHAWDDFVAILRTRRDWIRDRLGEQVQTNEVTRSAALLGGFLAVSERFGLPLRLLEIGSSAGLNLYWDHYRYETGGVGWGDPTSPVCLRSQWHGAPAALGAPVKVVDRRGCDLTPIDVTDPEQVRKLESFVWPDQLDRIEPLRAAIALVRRDPPRLDRRGAADWLAERLAEPAPGVTTVVFHSVMWWYLPESERDAVTSLVEKRGERANEPLAWLQMEIGGRDRADVRLRTWPGGDDRLLARSHFHGKEVWWHPDT